MSTTEPSFTTDLVAETLRYDPLSAAEKLTGKSYKEDEATSHLGLLMAMDHNKRKADLLAVTGDSHYGISFDKMLALYAELGFTEIWREQFDGSYGSETFVVLYHYGDGILASCESFGEDRSVNSTKIWYQIRLDSIETRWDVTSSGRMYDGDLWVGDHDVREGLRNTLARLREAGTFVSTWEQDQRIWMLNYSEKKPDGAPWDWYDAPRAARLARLPADVRRRIRDGGGNA